MTEQVQTKTVEQATTTFVNEKPVVTEVIEKPIREVHHRQHVTEIHEKPHIVFREEPVVVKERAPTQVQHIVEKPIVIDNTPSTRPPPVPNPYEHHGTKAPLVRREAEVRTDTTEVVKEIVEQQTFEIHKQPVVTEMIEKPVVEVHDQEVIHRVKDPPVVMHETAVAPKTTAQAPVKTTVEANKPPPTGTTIATTVPVIESTTSTYMSTAPDGTTPMLVKETVRYVPVEREHQGIIARLKKKLGIGKHNKK